MSQRPVCYGARRLNPFRGMLQVVELGDARALSLDGVRWEIQVLCAQPEHTWRSENRREPVMRFFRFGTWSREAGLRRVPVSPILDLDLLLSASSALTGVLPECLDGLPFPPADPHELWLLDAAGLPFSLIASTTRPPFGARIRPAPWAATARSDHSFQSPGLLERGIPARKGDDPRHHASRLERLVRDTAGHPTRLGWFERGADGGDSAAESEGKGGEGVPTTLAAEDFPSLLLREDWPEPPDRELVRDYLDWCAPYLLTLPGLSDAQRDRFEHAAKGRALEADALYRLYPKILNPGLLKAIRVEARVRRTATA
ncbi:MAG: hypothetical protein U9Q81_22015 [Pseudomonadota bacterium]|nr:hypothetical protein [Pseudomonadota bacterium]